MKTTNAPATSSMQSNAPYEEYGRRSQAREEARAACDTRRRSHSYGRLGVVAVAIVVAAGAFGLVTTHDLALTHIADGLGDQGANVHFEDHLEGGKMRFDYRMRAGVVEKSNALELMRSVGLDV